MNVLGWWPWGRRSRRLHVTSDGSPRDTGASGSDRHLAGGDTPRWTAAQFGLGWLADTYVLGKWGIEPKLPDAEAQKAWRQFQVDSAGQLYPREFQRVILMSAVLDGEIFVRRVAGKLMPMPKVSEIQYDKETDMPTQYTWRRTGRRTINEGPENVIHLFIHTRPDQKRGDDLYYLVADIARERRQFIFAVIKSAKMASLLRLFHKRRGNAMMGMSATQEDANQTVEIDWTQDGITEIGSNDEIISPSVSSGPSPILDVERAAGGAMGQPYGISRMQATRDYSDTSYSSARFASLVDAATWERYQMLVLRITREMYRIWDGRALFALDDLEPEWILPTFPSIDPVKDATVDKIYLELKVESPQEIIRRRGRDPEVVWREIEEWQQRQSAARPQPSVPEPAPEPMPDPAPEPAPEPDPTQVG